MSNIYYWEKLAFPKLAGKLNFSKKNWKIALALKRKKWQGLFGRIFILGFLSSTAFCLQNCVSDLF